ncbi:RNA repair transcriptional activator RtcR family protein [Vibrio coralliirubri]|uniref:RNA repair transcriptional activator RtcR family protein n=1 Tax=Vibrio coralliirubri TaxID=1516159 RepID=UPI00228410C4|nr:RNA repair transcriptional activator RtcR family protein [Vibrio coralliirubri]MCY9861228.1 RNA repair transcriptional activator RtcR family protein [Vibrio coralliirubri]
MHLISYLGFAKDNRGQTSNRNERFRPTVAALLHDDLHIDKAYLLYHPSHPDFLEMTLKDIKFFRPNLEVVTFPFHTEDDFDPASVFKALSGFVSELDQTKEYLINSVTGSTVWQVGWYDLIRMNRIDGKFLQIFQASKERRLLPDYDVRKGHYRIIDLKLSQYAEYRETIENLREKDKQFLKDGITTQNSTYNKLISTVERVAVSNNYPILITGATGVGKTELAKRLYRLKSNKGIVTGEFCYINCATLNRESALSSLFGHTKGAYTGALSKRDGILLKANKGVLFLDEIGCLPMDVQGMVLHAIESGKFTPLGSDHEVASSFSLICGTNEDLAKGVLDGTFRKDLLARIKLWNFNLPSLSERPEDIEPNIEYELIRFQQANGNIIKFTQEAKRTYLAYAVKAPWHCNFRDLSDSVKRMAVLCNMNLIDETDVSEEIDRLETDIFQSEDKGRLKTAKDYIKDGFASMGLPEPDMNLAARMNYNSIIGVCLEHETAKDAALTLYGDVGKNPSARLSGYLQNNLGIKFKDVKKYFA